MQRQCERAEQLQARAEATEAQSAQVVQGARLAMAIGLPIIAASILYLSWLLFTR